MTGAHDERGETLVELLIAVSIMAISIIAIVTAIGVAVKTSGIHKKQARVEVVLRNFAEQISDSGVKYSPLCNTSPYGSLSDGAYSASITGCSCLQGGSGSTFGACTTDNGAEFLTIRATGPDGQSKTLGFVKRS